MNKMSKGLFQEMLSISLEDQNFEDINEEKDDSQEEEMEMKEEESANILPTGSPVYPRIFWGDSAKPLMGQFPESEYVDDNIHNTYKGLLSYLG